MKSSVPAAAALLSFVARAASSAIPSSSAFAEPVTVTTITGGPGTFPPAQATSTSFAGSFTVVPTSSSETFIPGVTQTVTIPGDCDCALGSFTSSSPTTSPFTVTVSMPAVTISSAVTTSVVTTSSAVTTSPGVTTSSAVTTAPGGGTTLSISTVAPTTVNGGSQAPTTFIASTTTFIATNTPVSAVTSYFATGTPVSAVTSFFGTASNVPAFTSYFVTATAVPTLLPSSIPVVTVTMISSSAGCTCPQPSEAALKLKDTSSAMSRGGRAEGAFAVAVAGVLAVLI